MTTAPRRGTPAMYEERPNVWSGEPNAQLLTEASRLAPGTVLDVGCGEGADAVRLAGNRDRHLLRCAGACARPRSLSGHGYHLRTGRPG